MSAVSARPWAASGSSRSAGILVVALVHLAMGAALVEGFRRHAAPPPPPLTRVTIKPPAPVTPPIDRIQTPQPPKAPTVTPREIDIPIVDIERTPQTQPAVTPPANAATGGTEATVAASTGTGEAPVKAMPATPVAPGLVCTAMPSPEMPGVNWSGEALFRAVADVRGGRVVSAEIQALRGTMDSRTRRALINAIDATLKQGYRCPGDHRFQQEFSFKVD